MQIVYFKDVLFVMVGQNDGIGCQEQQCFEECMGYQMENCCILCLYVKCQEYVVNLVYGGIGQYVFDVGLYQCGEICYDQCNCFDNIYQMQNFWGYQEQVMCVCDQVDIGGNYGGGVDQCGDWCWIGYCVGKSGL